MTGATERPWAFDGDADGDFVIWSSGKFVANLGSPVQRVSDDPSKLVAFDLDRANALLIVRAVNAHDALVAALKRIAAPVSCGCNPCRGECKSANALFELEGRQEEALAALALAKEDAP